jgi:hypothetical protein
VDPEIGSFRGLVVTGYGQLLMLKLAAFAAMLALAAFNRFALTPRLALASDDARQMRFAPLAQYVDRELRWGSRSSPWSACSARCIPPLIL